MLLIVILQHALLVSSPLLAQVMLGRLVGVTMADTFLEWLASFTHNVFEHAISVVLGHHFLLWFSRHNKKLAATLESPEVVGKHERPE